MPKASVVAVILARGGSKGLPGKNIKPLHGKPLISYSIEAAKQSDYVERVIVSTDCEDIAKVARDYGAEVPFMRPAELATDTATSADAIVHALQWLDKEENYSPEYLILLQPTSPLRTTEDINLAMEKVLEHSGNLLVSVYKETKSPFWMKKIDADGYLQPFIEDAQVYTRRQDLPAAYMPNGAIYIAKSSTYLRERTFFTEQTLAYVMPKEKSVDIDDIYDWRLAELILEGA